MANLSRFLGFILCCALTNHRVAAQTMVGGLAFIFNAPTGATIGFNNFNISLGHVGWAFHDAPSKNFYFGATENFNGKFSVPPGPPATTQSWIQYGTSDTMFAAFKNAGFYHRANYYVYDRVKDVIVIDVNAAINKANEMATNGYDLRDNNCLTKTIDILNAYGAGLPFYGGDVISPNNYFNILPSEWSGIGRL